jgi:hypothetical protein
LKFRAVHMHSRGTAAIISEPVSKSRYWVELATRLPDMVPRTAGWKPRAEPDTFLLTEGIDLAERWAGEKIEEGSTYRCGFFLHRGEVR